MSIPVEKRDLGDGWVLTCHGEDGGDLTLSDVNIRRENLVCRVIGSELLYLPKAQEDTSDPGDAAKNLPTGPVGLSDDCVEEGSILDDVREIILKAQSHGCWRVGAGGIEKVRTHSRA